MNHGCAGLLVLCAGLVACGGSTSTCGSVALSAVQVLVLDSEGVPVDGADVQFRELAVEDADWLGCIGLGDGLYDCGLDVVGELEVLADTLNAPAVQGSVVVQGVGCPEQTASLTLSLG